MPGPVFSEEAFSKRINNRVPVSIKLDIEALPNIILTYELGKLIIGWAGEPGQKASAEHPAIENITLPISSVSGSRTSDCEMFLSRIIIRSLPDSSRSRSTLETTKGVSATSRRQDPLKSVRINSPVGVWSSFS